MKVRIFIEDRNYSKWSFHNLENNEEINELIFDKINPIENKLFSKDILLVHTAEQTTVETVYSSTKSNDKITGVLILEKNKTFGRSKNRLLYKCVPDDKHLPIFLIPFDIKFEFTKVQKNKYVVFRYDCWTDKHPQGIITETIGDVDNLEAFYEYQLYCKCLHTSLTDFNNKTKSVLKLHSHEDYIQKILTNKENFQIHDCRTDYVFTIDPINSLDFDDGFSIVPCEEDPTNAVIVSIYIANVYFWLEILGLWNSFSKRVATIYLPDRRRPMLPTVLSDNLCSLQENKTRFAFVMKIKIDMNTGIPIGEPTIINAVINVSKNYCYENTELLHEDVHYMRMLNITRKMNNKIRTSHDVVSHWMIYMNKTLGDMMAKNKLGIFRTTTFESSKNNVTTEVEDVTDDMSDDVKRVICSWNNNIGKYVLYGENNEALTHSMMLGKYIHITSPIRRLVDLLNQMIICRHLGLVVVSKDADLFMDNWTKQIDYINTSMRSIRKIQTDCELMNRCFTDSAILNSNHEGIIFDKIVKNDGTKNYMVYLEKIKLLSRIITHLELPVYSRHTFRIFLFEEEYKRKIRLQLLLE
jgi:exoribonuclease R